MRSSKGREILNSAVESFRPGYPRLSALLHSDSKFILFRRFGHLHARVLLHKQDALVELEQKLNDLDLTDTNAFLLTSRRSDDNAARLALLDELDIKLKEYGKVINIVSRPSDPLHDRLNTTSLLSASRAISTRRTRYQECNPLAKRQ